MLDFLLYPKSIALIGASRTAGKVGHEILSNLLHGGYEGEIIPVNPLAEEVLGRRCYGDLSEYEGSVDLCMVAVPADKVKVAVRSAIKAKSKAVAVITAGFREIGVEGAALEGEIAELCKKARIRLLGPNCLGLINTAHKMNASFSQRVPNSGNISVLSQSGALCTAMLEWASARHLGLSKVVSIGNEADLNETDMLKAFTEDEQTKVIIGYLENITSGEGFIKAAEAAVSVKPVVLYRAGVTRSGEKAAAAHTGNPAGDDLTYAAAFKRSGVIRAESFDSLFDFASALSMQPLPQGDRVAIITNAGGPGVIAADAIEQSGLEVAALKEETTLKLSEYLPAAAIVNNPIDILGDADPERYAMAVRAAHADESVDAIIVILAPHAMVKPVETAEAVALCTNGNKPVLAVFLGSSKAMREAEESEKCQMPVFPSPERAVAALNAMREYREWLNRPQRVITRFPVNRSRVDRIINRHVKMGQVQIGEVETKEILRAYDFNVPDGHIANSAEDAAEIAARIGFPVAMKIVSPDIIHKSNVGGIRLHISTTEMVRDTYDLLTLRVSRNAPEARIDGVYVEKMCGRGMDVVLGVTSDPKFGPMLMFGLGGTFVDVMKEVSCYLAPITADEALEMLRETRSYRILMMSRGQSDIDISAITGGLQRISQLAMDFPQIAVLSINPFTVGEVGIVPVVVDARIKLIKRG
ncbi:MAG: CoA-binding protein [Planctomycetes bacterium]|nr:CoA-binding protein [Planctomycetota bacterium]